ncbi:hypothetical protein [Rhodopirellula sp. SWK7]|uniref:hypothetical protein n=1 Tax=Rhodopirellula sp. SWK7 TaxID=595460 RepID=UPI001360B56A|nr:hypothetical protein [Rhodopirellula sp. SWK7]
MVSAMVGRRFAVLFERVAAEACPAPLHSKGDVHPLSKRDLVQFARELAGFGWNAEASVMERHSLDLDVLKAKVRQIDLSKPEAEPIAAKSDD